MLVSVFHEQTTARLGPCILILAHGLKVCFCMIAVDSATELVSAGKRINVLLEVLWDAKPGYSGKKDDGDATNGETINTIITNNIKRRVDAGLPKIKTTKIILLRGLAV